MSLGSLSLGAPLPVGFGEKIWRINWGLLLVLSAIAAVGVVNEQKGTAYRARSQKFEIAGKTGTAQVKRITERERDMGITQAQLPWHLRHHALFVCFGPVDNPRYACAVIIEHGMAGGATAGPIGRDVLVETMKRDPSRHTDRYRKMASR